jgi:uncharacterized protein (TIGR00730 family)
MKPDTSKHKPLPWQHIKAVTEDPDAPRRVQAIVSHPNYAAGDADAAFLTHSSTRGVRLQVDYLKPELSLEQQGVEHTIVVFGSTRIREPVSAQQDVTALKIRIMANPDDAELQRQLKVAERLLAKSHYYDVAHELGKLIATHCPGSCRVMLMTGGGPGVMEAANRGAFDVGAKSIGLNITLPHEQFPNPYVTPGLCFSFHYFAMRKLHFLQRARALIAFPGGFGTMDELFETLTLIQTRKMSAVPVVLVGESYWRKLVNFDFMVDEGVIEPEDRELFSYAESAEVAWRTVLEWHQANGTPLA